MNEAHNSKHSHLNTEQSKLSKSQEFDQAFMKATISTLEKKLKQKDQQITNLESLIQSMKIELDRLTDTVKDQKQWIGLLNSMASGTKAYDEIIDNVQEKIKTIDDVRNDRFQLKRLLLFEKKKYADLKNLYLALEQELKLRQIDFQRTAKDKLLAQKLQLERVLKDLSDEVEFLSRKNEEFLSQLKVRDYYEDYAKVKTELIKLKEAHIILIQILTLPPKDRSKFSIWTCGTTRAQGPTSEIDIDGFYTSKSQYADERTSLAYASTKSVGHQAKDKRSYSRYHFSRADEWQASKNLRHLLSKNVNFLSPTDSTKTNNRAEDSLSIGYNASILGGGFKLQNRRESVKTPTEMSKRMQRGLDQRSVSDRKQ